MPAATQRSPWTDRFRRPEPQDLLSGLPEPELADKAREALGELKGVSEQLSWQGIPWRWAFTYSNGGGAHQPLAALVPEPESPKLATALPGEFVESLQVRKLPRPVREALLNATPVGRMVWVEWPLTADVLDGALELFSKAREAEQG